MKYNSFHRLMLKRHGDYADMYFSMRGNILEVETIFVHEQMMGHGTRIVQSIIECGDREGWLISLTPCCSLGGDEERLTEFYRRFGFVFHNGKFDVEGSMVLDLRKDTKRDGATKRVSEGV